MFMKYVLLQKFCLILVWIDLEAREDESNILGSRDLDG